MMICTCLRCGYQWSARTEVPKRCPACKSTRWNKEAVTNKCLRCGAEWTQRGDRVPKFCPVCHSGMWNTEKYTYTCPKCGRTHILRSNSRPGLCPVCDRYADVRPRIGFAEFRPRIGGISKVIKLWSDGEGMTMTLVDDGRYTAYLYRRGELVSTASFAPWCRSNGVSLDGFIEGRPTPGSDEKLRDLALSMESRGKPDEGKVENIQELRGVTREQAMIISLHDAGMDPLPISLKLGLTFSEVMDTLSGSHPISGKGISPRSPQEGSFPTRDGSAYYGHERA